MLKYEDYYYVYPVIYRLNKILAKVITFMTNSYNIFCLQVKRSFFNGNIHQTLFSLLTSDIHTDNRLCILDIFN